MLRNFEGNIYRYPDPDGRSAPIGRCAPGATDAHRSRLRSPRRVSRAWLLQEETAEFDSVETIDAAGRRARSAGLRAVRVGRGQALAARLVAGERLDLVFSIAEGLKGRSREAQVPALSTLFEQPYLFSDPLTAAAALTRRWPSSRAGRRRADGGLRGGQS